MVTFNIDGKVIQAKEGATILEAACENNIYIPTLCVNEAVAAYGACRLCMVEATRGKRTRIVASCLYEVADDLVVDTKTERILNIRRMVIELLLARCPNSPEIRDMAENLGVTSARFKPKNEDSLCVLCALCTRACKEVVGKSAITLINRGTQREVGLPYYDDADACIACGSCVYICPTQAIKREDLGDKRIISWPNSTQEFKLHACSTCGSYFAPEKQLEFMAAESGVDVEQLKVCMSCR